MLPQTSRRIRTLLVAGVVMLSLSCANAQSIQSVRREFLADLSNVLLGSDTIFVPDGEAAGWRGVVLSAPGTSSAALTEAYNGYAREIARETSFVSSFDRVIEVQDGTARFLLTRLDDVWIDFLSRSMPQPIVRKMPSSATKWLYRQPDKIDSVRGIRFSNEPSEFWTKYRQYSLSYQNLLNGRLGDTWRLDPKLSGYVSFQEAEKALLEDWTRFGYKIEIENAIRDLQSSQNDVRSRVWARSKALFDISQVPLDGNVSTSQSILLPPPLSWGQLASWTRLSSKPSGIQQPISYQIARIKIERPWLDLPALLSKSLFIDAAAPANAGFQLSSGEVPTFERSPKGAAAVFAEEIILVRSIHPPDSASAVPTSLHPLSLFAYPDAVNILGYIVRVLPKVPN